MTTIGEKLKKDSIIKLNYLTHSSFVLQSKLIYITYPKRLSDFEKLRSFILNKLLSIDSTYESIIGYSMVAESKYMDKDYTHIFVELKNSPKKKIRNNCIFDLDDGTKPDVIASINRSDNIYQKIYTFQHKLEKNVISSFEKEDKNAWEAISIAKDTKSTTSKTISYSTTSSSMIYRHIITKPPEDYILSESEKLIMNFIDQIPTQKHSNVLYVINSSLDSPFGKFENYLYNHIEGVCPVQYSFFNYLSKFVHTYNISTSDLPVKAICMRINADSKFPSKKYSDIMADFLNNNLYKISKVNALKINQISNPLAIILSQSNILEKVSELSVNHTNQSYFLFVNQKTTVMMRPDFELTEEEIQYDIDYPPKSEESVKMRYKARFNKRGLKKFSVTKDIPCQIYYYYEIIRIIYDPNSEYYLRKYFAENIGIPIPNL